MGNKLLVVGVLAAIPIVPVFVLGVLILATEEGRTPPGAITGLIATDASDANRGQIDLAWNPSDAEDFAYYAIYASEIEITDVTGLSLAGQINDRADASYRVARYEVSGLMLALTEDTEYWFAVTAVDLAGNESKVGTSTSATIEVTPPSPIPTVFNIVIEAVHYSSTATVSLGTTVVWTNPDVGPHTVTSDRGLFHSGHIASDDTFSYTFTELGVFYYRCRLHFWGILKVLVE